jgi:hypothetical protein
MRYREESGRYRATSGIIRVSLSPSLEEDPLKQISCVLLVLEVGIQIPIDLPMVAIVQLIKWQERLLPL